MYQNLNDTFEKQKIQHGKIPPGGRAEIEIGKYVEIDIFNFNSATIQQERKLVNV